MLFAHAEHASTTPDWLNFLPLALVVIAIVLVAALLAMPRKVENPSKKAK